MSSESREVAAAIDAAMAALQAPLEAGLASRGWRSVDAGFRPYLLTFTRDIGDGFWLSANLIRDAFSWPARWPISLKLIFGVGYEKATALMPIVTLPPRTALLLQPDAALSLSLAEPEAVDELAGQVNDAVMRYTADLGERRYSVEELDADLALRGERETPYRAVLQAAAGNHERARQLVGQIVVRGPDDDSDDWRAKRAVRQLTRWLDAGGGEIPPLQDSLWLVAKPPLMGQREPIAGYRSESRRRREAVDAVKAAARGRSTDELASLLLAEHARRGIELSPQAAAMLAEQIAATRGPFGRARRAMQGVRAARDFAGLGMDIVKHRVPPEPEWLRVPDRASYPVRGSSEFTEVTLDPDAGPWLARAASESARHIGPLVMVQLWLSPLAGGDETLVVHLGERAVGQLPPAAAQRFAADLKAAQFFDEDLRVVGQLVVSPDRDRLLLQVSLPRG